MRHQRFRNVLGKNIISTMIYRQKVLCFRKITRLAQKQGAKVDDVTLQAVERASRYRNMVASRQEKIALYKKMIMLNSVIKKRNTMRSYINRIYTTLYGLIQ